MVLVKAQNCNAKHISSNFETNLICSRFFQFLSIFPLALFYVAFRVEVENDEFLFFSFIIILSNCTNFSFLSIFQLLFSHLINLLLSLLRGIFLHRYLTISFFILIKKRQKNFYNKYLKSVLFCWHQFNDGNRVKNFYEQ